MSKHGSRLRRAVRARMAETGDGWQKALAYVRSRMYVERGLLPIAPDDPTTTDLAASSDFDPKVSPEVAEAFLARLRTVDPADQDRFTIGVEAWSPDGKTWHPGPAPASGSSDAGSMTVTAVDPATGTITVKAR